MVEQFFTTDEENLKTRVSYLEGLISKLNATLTLGREIGPGSEAHRDLYIACGHSLQEWLTHPCPWIVDCGEGGSKGE